MLHGFHRLITLALLLLLTPCAVMADATPEELVLNGNFDEDVMQWSAPAAHVALAHDPLDASELEDSGSARVTTSAISPLTRRGSAQQCVPTRANSPFDMSARAQTPSGQNRQGVGSYLVDWYEGELCTGALIDTDSAGQIGATDTGVWRLLDPGSPVQSPANARSAMLRLQVQQDVFGFSVFILFDEVSFVPEPSATVANLAVLLGLVALRRRRA